MCSQYGISESSSIVILQAKLSIELQKQSCSAISTDKSKRTLTPSTTALRGLSLSSVVAAQWPASRRNRHRSSIQWLMTRVMGGEISFPCHSQRQICAVLCVNLMKNFSRRGRRPELPHLVLAPKAPWWPEHRSRRRHAEASSEHCRNLRKSRNGRKWMDIKIALATPRTNTYPVPNLVRMHPWYGTGECMEISTGRRARLLEREELGAVPRDTTRCAHGAKKATRAQPPPPHPRMLSKLSRKQLRPSTSWARTSARSFPIPPAARASSATMVRATVRTGLGSKVWDPSSNAARTNSACSAAKKYWFCGKKIWPSAGNWPIRWRRFRPW